MEIINWLPVTLVRFSNLRVSTSTLSIFIFPTLIFPSDGSKNLYRSLVIVDFPDPDPRQYGQSEVIQYDTIPHNTLQYN